MGRLEDALLQCQMNNHTCEGGIFQATGVQKHVLSRFRRGLCSMKLETIEKLLDYYGIELVIPDRFQEASNGHYSKYTKTPAWYREQEKRRVERKRK